MTNPEIEYERLVSGDAAAIRSFVAELDGALHRLNGIREDLAGAGEIPVWSGDAAMAFASRLAMLHQGLSVTRSAVVRARGALEAGAGAYEQVEDDANYYIAFWRNRPGAMPGVIEEIYALAVNGCLLSLGAAYNQQLAAIEGVLTGEELDLDALDEETREWVEEGLAKNQEWLDGSQNGLGPLIPHTAATGDDRGLIPQGLGYDPETGLLLQGYYTKGHESYVALIDSVTGNEIGTAQLGGFERPGEQSGGPTHAGGVTVDGDRVYVVDNGEVYTYSLSDLRNAAPGTTISQATSPQLGLQGGSYSAFKDGKLYLGDHETDKLHVYERGIDGNWQPVETVDTPPNCQGVLVRDGEFVFSASSGRHEDNSQLYVQDFDGTRSQPYYLPSMSQGVVEVDGEVVVTYESAAEHFDHPLASSTGWLLGVYDYWDMWANPYMTQTPLSDLGLGQPVEVEPGTLLIAADELAAPADALKKSAADVRAVNISVHLFGRVPKAAELSATIDKLTDEAAVSLRAGSAAVDAAAELLASTSKDYSGTDGRVHDAFTRLDSRLGSSS